MIDLLGVNVVLNLVHCDWCFDKFYYFLAENKRQSFDLDIAEELEKWKKRKIVIFLLRLNLRVKNMLKTKIPYQIRQLTKLGRVIV